MGDVRASAFEAPEREPDPHPVPGVSIDGRPMQEHRHALDAESRARGLHQTE